MAPWGECWGCKTACLYIYEHMKAGLECECGFNYADRRKSDWLRALESDWTGENGEGGGLILPLQPAGSVCVCRNGNPNGNRSYCSKIVALKVPVIHNSDNTHNTCMSRALDVHRGSDSLKLRHSIMLDLSVSSSIKDTCPLQFLLHWVYCTMSARVNLGGLQT